LVGPGSDDAADAGSEDRRRDPIEQAMDVFLYAPLGFVLEAHRLWPHVVARGRQEVEESRAWFERRMRSAASEAEAALRGLGLIPGQEDDNHAGHHASEEPLAGAPAPFEPPPASLAGLRPVERGPAAIPGSGVPADALAIPGYDSLSASQVVPRLAGLDPEELELVRKYEIAGRGRRTILSRIAQLQDG
jgi:hypothetical protein